MRGEVRGSGLLDCWHGSYQSRLPVYLDKRSDGLKCSAELERLRDWEISGSLLEDILPVGGSDAVNRSLHFALPEISKVRQPGGFVYICGCLITNRI